MEELGTLRKKLVLWEQTFNAQHGHKPSVAEIQNNSEILQLYREYRTLKQVSQGHNDTSLDGVSGNYATCNQSKKEIGSRQQIPTESSVEAATRSARCIENVSLGKAQPQISPELSRRTPKVQLPACENLKHWKRQREKSVFRWKSQQTASNLDFAKNTQVTEDSKENGESESDPRALLDTHPNPQLDRSYGSSKQSSMPAVNVSTVISKPRRGLLQTRERCEQYSSEQCNVGSPSCGNVDHFGDEALTPFDTTVILSSPKRDRVCLKALDELSTIKKHKSSDLDGPQDLLKKSIGLVDGLEDSISDLVGQPAFSLSDQLEKQQAATYSKIRTLSFKKCSKGADDQGVPVRENFVRMQLGHRKRMKGRGSTSGGGRPMGWKKSGPNSKFGSRFKQRCFNCGKNGHWVKECPSLCKGDSKESNGADVLDLAADSLKSKTLDCDESNFEKSGGPEGDTVMSSREQKEFFMSETLPTRKLIEDFVDKDTVICEAPTKEISSCPTTTPFLDKENLQDQSLKVILSRVFGYNDFRPGQEETLSRVLEGKSTLFVCPTGGGKSLCYQLPAYKLQGTMLVISPLLSLIQDQLDHLPKSIRGATLNSQQNQDDFKTVIQKLKERAIDVLFVAPERLFTDAFVTVAQQLPPFPLVCIDEIHCISEWAHNFRPTYMRLGPMLRDVLRAGCILGLTATCPRWMDAEILNTLGIDDEGIVRSDILRENLRLSVSKDGNRQLAVLDMLQKDPRFNTESVIVYCGLRNQCEDLAMYLIGQSISADFYHAGRTIKDRTRIQNRFFSGKLRVIVATVAFGMGLDKEDVRGIIHFCCPSSIESYVQEIGRAGRDGRNAFCHTFLQDTDISRMKSFAYSEGIELSTAMRLVDDVLIGNVKGKHSEHRIGHLVQINENEGARFDLSKESIETIFCFLEQDGYVEVCNPCAALVTIAFLTTERETVELSSSVVRTILRLASPRNGQWALSPSAIANALGCTVSEVNRELRSLRASRLLRVVWTGRAQTCRLLKVFSNEADSLAAARAIHARFMNLQERKLSRLQILNEIMSQVAEDFWTASTGETASGRLARSIQQYFEQSDLPHAPVEREVTHQSSHGFMLQADIVSLVQSIRSDQPLLTGRSVARIFHGIQSPAFPARIWWKHRSWGKYTTTDFELIRKISEQIICDLGGE